MKRCSFCKKRKSFSAFHAEAACKDGYQRACKRCKAIRGAVTQPKRRVLCGNGIRSCWGKTTCTRHACYAGLSFDLDEVALLAWLETYWFDGATVDRIDPTVGYVCAKGDVIDETRFGNVRLISKSENSSRVRRTRKKAA